MIRPQCCFLTLFYYSLSINDINASFMPGVLMKGNVRMEWGRALLDTPFQSEIATWVVRTLRTPSPTCLMGSRALLSVSSACIRFPSCLQQGPAHLPLS